MVPMLFAAEETATTGIGALGINLGAFLIQLASFILVFLVLKKFAFKPVIKLLNERRSTIEEGVKAGQELAREREKLQTEVAKVMADARVEADRIIANGQKEAREIVREAEKAAQNKSAAMLIDAEARIEADSEHARRKLQKEIANLVAEAASAVVEEKIDPKKDAALIDRALKGRK